MLTKIVACLFSSERSIQVFTRIGSSLLVRAELTTAVMYDAVFEPALSEPELLLLERAFGSHLFLSTRAM